MSITLIKKKAYNKLFFVDEACDDTLLICSWNIVKCGIQNIPMAS